MNGHMNSIADRLQTLGERVANVEAQLEMALRGGGAATQRSPTTLAGLIELMDAREPNPKRRWVEVAVCAGLLETIRDQVAWHEDAHTEREIARWIREMLTSPAHGCQRGRPSVTFGGRDVSRAAGAGRCQDCTLRRNARAGRQRCVAVVENRHLFDFVIATPPLRQNRRQKVMVQIPTPCAHKNHERSASRNIHLRNSTIHL